MNTKETLSPLKLRVEDIRETPTHHERSLFFDDNNAVSRLEIRIICDKMYSDQYLDKVVNANILVEEMTTPVRKKK